MSTTHDVPIDLTTGVPDAVTSASKTPPKATITTTSPDVEPERSEIPVTDESTTPSPTPGTVPGLNKLVLIAAVLSAGVAGFLGALALTWVLRRRKNKTDNQTKK